MSWNRYSLDYIKRNADNHVNWQGVSSNQGAYLFFWNDTVLQFTLILLPVSIQMARKLSALEILLIIFIIIVLAVDILLLMLLLEKPSGKGDACGYWVGRIETAVPSGCQRHPFMSSFLSMPPHCIIHSLYPQLIQINFQMLCSCSATIPKIKCQ